MAASRSSELNLYASEDKSDNDKRVQFSCSNADFAMGGEQAAKMSFATFQIKGESDQFYDVTTRIAAVEADVANNNTSGSGATAAVAADLAQEQVDRAAQDTVLGNQISAEISSRATADQAIQDALDVQEAKQASDLVNTNAAIASETSDRQTAVSAEATARAADIAGLQAQLTNLIGASTPAALQNLSAIVAAFQGADTNHTSQIASVVTRMDSVEALLNQLVNAGL